LRANDLFQHGLFVKTPDDTVKAVSYLIDLAPDTALPALDQRRAMAVRAVRQLN
jgi:hypothetical protein